NPDGFPLPPDTSGTTSASTSDAETSTSNDSGPDPDGTSSDSSDGGNSCTFCDAPNQACIDDQCVTTCQGQQPDPCGPDQVCDVQTGECREPGAACTVAGEYEPCGAAMCGPGSVCDEQGECIPVAPCADVVCLDDGTCWGDFCSCERQITCAPPSEADLNAAFSVEISDLEFSDDCTAWMVTLRSGTDFLRRLSPDGTLTEWGGVANLNMGEVKVLKSVTPPARIGADRPEGLRADGRGPTPDAAEDLDSPPTAGVEGLGEVALTYTCCSACGCFVDPPQGVARLEEDDPMNPLPLVVEATVTQGMGPFGATTADAGPFGLTWGIDRVLYVGNSTANGDIVTADLEMGTQAALGTLPARITAGAPISAAHLLLAIEGGDVYRFNVLTLTSTLVTSLGEDVTSLSQDSFDGTVYVGLRDLEVVALNPWTGTFAPFATMPGRGRVTVSPNGELWFSPVAVLDPNPIMAWDLPDAF
ncbi:MAG: hypothetical protein AAF799_48465, partial [Myxococcota bacterium]